MSEPNKAKDDDTKTTDFEGDLAKSKEENLKLEGRIEELKKHENASEQLSSLIADPDVRNLLRAKQNGDPVQVLVGDEKDPDPDKKGKNLDEMSRSELAEHIIQESAKASKEVIQEGLGPVNDTLASLNDDKQEARKTELAKEVTTTRKKFEDFNEYQEAIAGLHETNPTLTVEELYYVAKQRAGKDITEKVNPASEKPSSTAASPPKKKQRDKPVPPTSKGFSQILTEYQEGSDYKANDGLIDED